MWFHQIGIQVGSIPRGALGRGPRLSKALPPRQGCFACPWTCLTSHLSADLVQLETSERLSFVTPTNPLTAPPAPPPTAHTHGDTNSFSLGPTQGPLTPFSPYSDLNNARAPLLHLRPSHTPVPELFLEETTA